MAKWVVSSSSELAAPLERYARACDAAASVTHVGDGAELRRRLRADLAGALVLVADGAGGAAGLDAVNVAAAVAADGRAAEVALVTASGSGSLRSRAKRAGIGRVLDVSELAMALRETETSLGGFARERGELSREGRKAKREGRSVDARLREASSAEPHAAEAPARAKAVAQGAELVAERVAGEGEGEQTAGRRPVLPSRAASANGTAAQAPVQQRVERREGVPVIAFVSGRGGVGKSTLVACAAHMAAAWGMDVACLDLDLAFGNLFSLCGASRQADLFQAAECDLDDKALEGLGVAAAERVHVWGPCRNPEYAEVVHPLVAEMVARLTHNHDLVLVDTTASWGDATACVAQLADRLVIVSDERPGAIPALSRCGSLAVRLGIARTRIVRLMNGCDPRMRDATFVARAAVGLECAREIRVPDGGLEVVELMSTGKAAELVSLDNPMPVAVAHGLAQLLKELGTLPECEAAAKALEGKQRSKRPFFRMREAS